MPATTSLPSFIRARACCSISYVLPTPGAAPTKIRSLPTRRSSRRAASRRASGEGRCSESRRCSAILIRYLDRSEFARLPGRQPVQRDIELQHVHARLAQQAQKAALRGVLDELPDSVFG